MRRFLIGLGLVGVFLSLATVSATAAPARTAAPSAEPRASVVLPARRVPPTGLFIPPHVGGGDRNFAGHGPDIIANATLAGVGTSRLTVVLFMHATETMEDWTEAEGSSFPQYGIYQAPAGQCVKSVSLGTFDELAYRDTDTATDTFAKQFPGSFVRTYSVVGDTTAHDESGVRTGFAINTERLTVTIGACS